MEGLRIVFVVIFGSFTFSVLSVPIDLLNTDAQKVILPRNNTGPGICKENINNDNITMIMWYRYHNESHKCWHIDEKGPCGRMMLFYGIGDTPYGTCDCNLYYRCARPIIYWPPTNRCYYTNDQGPCGSNLWLVLDDTQKSTCKQNSCMQNQTVEPSTYDRYWFEENGTCYKTLTQGYCNNTEEVLYPKWDESKPSCNIGRICNARNVRSSTKSGNECVPGQKRDQQGRCRPAIRVTNLFKAIFFKR